MMGEVSFEQMVAADSSKLPDNHREWTEDQRQLFVKHLRFQFCRRADFPETSEMLNLDGSFNDKYFETQVVEQAERKWTENERVLLLRGIEEYGIGHFGEISAALLPEWTSNELRVKSMHLMGRQNLSLYKDWKGDAAAVQREFERNKEIGLKTGCWKANVLVSDDNGVVQSMILATQN